MEKKYGEWVKRTITEYCSNCPGGNSHSFTSLTLLDEYDEEGQQLELADGSADDYTNCQLKRKAIFSCPPSQATELI